jgi:hypothetical protein
LRARGKKIISVAWTGIASTLLFKGQTVTSTFQLPIDLHESSNSTMKLNSPKAKLLQDIDVFLWDEAPMTPLDAVNAVNRLLQRLCDPSKVFGGKLMIMGGDFRQIPPVVPHGTRTQIVENSIKSGLIWNKFVKLELTINMRAGLGKIH